jgi:hypothetical protein
MRLAEANTWPRRVRYWTEAELTTKSKISPRIDILGRLLRLRAK